MEHIDKVSRQVYIMTNAWEDVTWEHHHGLKEWIVEYIAKVGEESTHHLTVLRASDMEHAQSQLMQELRTTYAGASEIEVTVIRMEEMETEPNIMHFQGAYTP